MIHAQKFTSLFVAKSSLQSSNITHNARHVRSALFIESFLLIPQRRFLLRRTAVRAISATPSKAYLAKPRSITTLTPSAFRLRQPQWSIASFQRRFASDEVTKSEADENFAQTASEAPVDENLTPAQQEAQAAPTDAAKTVGPDALEAVFENPRERKPRTPREPRNNAPNNMLYIGNLYYEVTADQLKRVFSRFGDIESVKIVFDNRGMSRG
jgi:nucleolin